MDDIIRKPKFKKIKQSKYTLVNNKPQKWWFKYAPTIPNVIKKSLAKYENVNVALSAENILGKRLGNPKDRIQKHQFLNEHQF